MILVTCYVWFVQKTLTLPAPQIAAEFFTAEEMSFKKVKKKVRKIRKKNKVVTADDLLPLADDTAAGSDLGSRRGRRLVRFEKKQCTYFLEQMSLYQDSSASIAVVLP